MYVAVDIGGTSTRVALFKNLSIASLVRKTKYPTPQKYKDGLKILAETIQRIAKKRKIDGVGVSFCEVVDSSSGYIPVIPDNLPNWRYKYLVTDLQLALGKKTKVIMRTDSECGALAEMKFAAGKDIEKLYLFIIGTGVGGAFVDRNALPVYVLQTEIGHMIIDKNDTKIFGKTQGSLSTFTSGKHLSSRYKINLRNISKEDPMWDRVASDLAVGIANVVAIFNPDEVALAGGVIEKQKHLLKTTLKFLKRRLKVFPIPKIRITKFGDNFGLYGALSLLS